MNFMLSSKLHGTLPVKGEEADLVAEMKEVKHYYREGIMARDGIEK